VIVSDRAGSFEVNIISLHTCTETLVIIFDWVGSFEENVISLHIFYRVGSSGGEGCHNANSTVLYDNLVTRLKVQ